MLSVAMAVDSNFFVIFCSNFLFFSIIFSNLEPYLDYNFFLILQK